MTADRHYMRVALSLAARNLGQTWPNPAVGAVIVKEGRIIGEGYTARGGRPHAETQALAMAGSHAQGATFYVTLEPCSHHGQTAPCAEAIIQSGIARCIVACRDPNPQVNGQGIERLRAAGIKVVEQIGAQEASELNSGFFSVIEKKRPFIALKLATSLDGKMATASGQSRWITGESARQYGHLLRSRHDAIATGIGTVLADDPMLTCRLPGLEDRSPVRVVFDRQGRLPPQSALAKTSADVPVWIMDSPLPEAVRQLTDKGITRLLVEAGPTLSTAFLHSDMVDRIYWFRAPMVIGGEGMSALDSGFTPNISQLARWRQIGHIALSPDTLDVFACSPA